MVTHSTGDADGAWRAFSLKPGGDIDDVAMQVGSVGYYIADVEPDAEPDSQIGLLAFVPGHTSLHRQSGTHRPIDTVEYGKQRVASGLDESAAMPIDRRIDNLIAQRPESIERSHVIDAD
jgi:hypothetical protein